MNKRIAIFGSLKYDTCEYHIADSLRHLGYEVQIFDYSNSTQFSKKTGYWFRRFFENHSIRVCKSVAKRVINFNPDLVIATYRDIHPIFVDTVKQQLPDVMCIHINPDAITTFQKQQLFASNYDHYFTKDPFIAKFMQDKMELKAHLVPESFNPRVHVKPEIPKKEAEAASGIDVLVFGGMYPYRTKMLERMNEAGIKMAIYGAKGCQFPASLESSFHDRIILGKEKSDLMYGAKIVFNNFHYAEIGGVNCKFFEINGVGGFQICDYKKSIEEYVTIDASKVTFNNIEEGIEKLLYYLDPSNEEERLSLAEKNYLHFMSNHTYEHRIKQIFQIIGF